MASAGAHKFTSNLKGYGESARRGLEDAGESAKNAAEEASDAAAGAFNRGTEAAKNAGDAVVSGIQDIGDSAKDAMERLRVRLEAAQAEMEPDNRVDALLSAGWIPSNTEVPISLKLKTSLFYFRCP